MTPAERDFVDRMGILFDNMGSTRASGRVVAWLLICEPPHQSSQELAERLSLSKGSVSTITRQLVAGSLVEQVHVDGERSTYFRVRQEGWAQALVDRMRFLTHVIELADRGLAVVGDDPERRKRLESFRNLYAFMDREFRSLIERYAKEVS